MKKWQGIPRARFSFVLLLIAMSLPLQSVGESTAGVSVIQNGPDALAGDAALEAETKEWREQLLGEHLPTPDEVDWRPSLDSALRRVELAEELLDTSRLADAVGAAAALGRVELVM